jgi:hypothetical protein
VSESGLGRVKTQTVVARVEYFDCSVSAATWVILEDCIFYIFSLYEFLHSLGHQLTGWQVADAGAATINRNQWSQSVGARRLRLARVENQV